MMPAIVNALAVGNVYDVNALVDNMNTIKVIQEIEKPDLIFNTYQEILQVIDAIKRN
ncbi:MAG: hypothetical protein ACREAN_08620 [Nitrosopumilaceae archaeon]